MNARALTVLACVLSAPVFAAGPCVQGTLADYIALGADGCTQLGVTFANFGFTATSTQSIPPNQIQVTPVSAIPLAPGFVFSAPWKANPGQAIQSLISYSVTPPVPSSTTAQGQLSLSLGPAGVGGIIGGVGVTEDTNVGSLTVFERCADVCGIDPSAQLLFKPIQPLQVVDRVNISGGRGGASLSSFSVSYNFCPLCV